MTIKNQDDKIKDSINKSICYIRKSFNDKCYNKFDFFYVYPYLDTKNISNCNIDEKFYSNYKNIGELYEDIIPLNIKKDYGQFYTNDIKLIDSVLDNLDLFKGKILEPSCGSGLFVIAILKRLIKGLKQKQFSSEEILNYICDNIYANDIDINALKIAELNTLYFLLPLIIDAKKKNNKFVMKKLKFTNFDFVKKSIINESFSVIIGNPPFVTLYGKRSRDMNEQKRTYYNTFNFVQNKKGNNKFNISMFFIENALELLEINGQLSYILDISFFENAFKDLRKYIIQNYHIVSIITGISGFSNVASGQLIIKISKINSKNNSIVLTDYNTQESYTINQKLYDDVNNDYKIFKPLSFIEKNIKLKMDRYDTLKKIFPNKSLRTCCALTGRTEDFIVNKDNSSNCTIFPFIEGSKGLYRKFCTPKIERYIKYDYDLQLKISNEFKKELEIKGVKNKKRVTLGDKDAYLSNKIFIRQSSNEIIATYCRDPYAANNSIYILTTKENNEHNEKLLKYVCGLLNSNLISFYSKISNIIRCYKGKIPQIKISDLKKIPIIFNEAKFDEIVSCVDILLNNQDNKNIYKKLNDYIYSIYGITPEEITYIENNIKNKI